MKNFNWQNIPKIVLALMVVSLCSRAFAMGLGEVKVRSYLNQPLLARIQLISQSGEELGTVTAGLASAEDMEMMGLTRSISVPLHFDVYFEPGNAYVDVTSRIAITDPVVQMVLEVRWSGGRMLREYTMFLDPPTFASRAPLPVVSSPPSRREPVQAQSPPVEDFPDPSAQDFVETIKPPSQPIVAVQKKPEVPFAAVEDEPENVDSFLETRESPAVSIVKEAVEETTRQTATVPADPIIADPADSEAVLSDTEFEPETVIEEISIPDSETEPPPQELETIAEDTSESQQELSVQAPEEPAVESAEPEPAGLPTETVEAEPADSTVKSADEAAESPVQSEDLVSVAEESTIDEDPAMIDAEYGGGNEIIGPVQRGETLWAIASTYKANRDFSINQAMLAIQRLNPEAFNRNNINSLKQGAILRMPALSETRRLTKRNAMLEAMRQEQAYLARRAGKPIDSLPVISDQWTQQLGSKESDQPDLPGDTAATREARLELVPPSQLQDQSGSGSGSGETATGAVSAREVQEVLARTEEELANAQQENAYLNERILELEAQIAARQTDGLLTDSNLAEMEQSLREKRISEGTEVEDSQSSGNEDELWYLSNAWWVGGLLLLIIAAVVLTLRRIGGGNEPAPVGESAPEQEREEVEISRSEAIDDLKSQDDPARDSPDAGNVIELEDFVDPSSDSVKTEALRKGGKKAKIIPIENENAVELDTDDPEVKLDLARAYLSMGDKDAAGEMLKEILETGNELQVREAREMMEEL